MWVMSRVIQKCSGLDSLHTKDCLLDFSQTKKQGVSAERERERLGGRWTKREKEKICAFRGAIICMTLQYIYILYHKLNHLGLRLIHVYISPLIYVLEGKYLTNTIMKI